VLNNISYLKPLLSQHDKIHWKQINEGGVVFVYKLAYKWVKEWALLYLQTYRYWRCL